MLILSKRAIIEGLPSDMKDIMLATDICGYKEEIKITKSFNC